MCDCSGIAWESFGSDGTLLHPDRGGIVWIYMGVKIDRGESSDNINFTVRQFKLFFS